MPDAALAAADVHAHTSPRQQHHFDSMAQQKETATLGMWVFLVTEIMFFGGMFAAYVIYRMWHYEGFVAGSQQLDLVLGSVNTAVLIGSSLTVALAVHAAQTNRQRQVVTYLVLTGALGLVFLVIKYFEYSAKFHPHALHGGGVGVLFPAAGWFDIQGPLEPLAPGMRMFLVLYFALTGMHAVHMIVGVGILAVILWMAIRRQFSKEWYTPVEIFGLYWHFVDIVWIFLFPLLYLVNRHG